MKEIDKLMEWNGMEPMEWVVFGVDIREGTGVIQGYNIKIALLIDIKYIWTNEEMGVEKNEVYVKQTERALYR